MLYSFLKAFMEHSKPPVSMGKFTWLLDENPSLKATREP